MLAGIFDADLGIFDILTLIGAVLLFVAAFAIRPAPRPSGITPWATTLAYLGLGIFALAFLFMTP